eukprot:3498659-Rhodomonas_salina.3
MERDGVSGSEIRVLGAGWMRRERGRRQRAWVPRYLLACAYTLKSNTRSRNFRTLCTRNPHSL